MAPLAPWLPGQVRLPGRSHARTAPEPLVRFGVLSTGVLGWPDEHKCHVVRSMLTLPIPGTTVLQSP
jgi:hypothetical protein